MTEIRFLNRDVKVTFNMGSQIVYERITDKAFDLSALVTTEARLVLYFACILTADENTDITMKDLLEKTTVEDIRNIDNAINAEMSAWYNIPEPAKVEEEKSEEESPNL